MRRLLVAALVPLILLAAVGGAVAWNNDRPGAHRATFLRDLRDRDDRAPRLAVEVRQHPRLILAAGHQACAWATTSPAARMRTDPWEAYARTLSLSPGAATIEAEDIAESAWDALCPQPRTPGDDE